MDIKYLRTFRTILETGSFLNAARKLNCTQSTITFQIQLIERELNCQLFEKVGRRMIVTQKGKDLLPYVDNILQSYVQMRNHGKTTEELTGTLNVAIPDTLLTYQMQPVLKAFREQAPGVRLLIQVLNCYNIRDRVINGEFDLGVHYNVGHYGSSILSEPLADFPLVLVASPVVNPSLLDFITTQQHIEVCLVANDTASLYHAMFIKYLNEREIQLNSIMQIGSIEAVKRGVMSNLGISYLPKFVVQEELKDGRLIEIKTAMDEKKMTAVCIQHKNKVQTAAMALFSELTKQLLTSSN